MPDARDHHPPGPEALDALLRQLETSYARLETLLQAKRDAIRTAQLDGIPDLCDQERDVIRHIGALDRRRLAWLTASGFADAGTDDPPATLNAICDRLDARHAATLRARADALQERILEVRRQSAILREAANSLADRMHALMQNLHASHGNGGVYGRHGDVEADLPGHRGIDVTV